MELFRLFTNRLILLFSFVIGTLFMIIESHAQGMMGSNMSCPMCGTMGWGGMILMSLLILSVIAALVALSYFLIRRSRTHSH